MDVSSDPLAAPAGMLDGELFTSPKSREWLASEALPHYVPRCRWFAGKALAPRRFEIKHAVSLGEARLLFVRVAYPNNNEETYLLPCRISETAIDPHTPG